MKNLKVVFAMVAMAMFTFLSANDAKAQDIGQIAGGLLNLQVGQVIGDITVGDVTVVDVDDSEILTDFQINALNNVLRNSPILSNNRDVSTDLLRDADIIEDNQVVVGILAGTILVQ